MPDDDTLRQNIADLLASGLQTEILPRAESSAMFNNVQQRLQSEAGDSMVRKLVIAGFSHFTVEADGIEQPCETCKYYLVHRKFCELPELMLPVEPHWSCRLWRI